MSHPPYRPSLIPFSMAVLCASLLSACGGGSGGETEQSVAAVSGANAGAAAAATTTAVVTTTTTTTPVAAAASAAESVPVVAAVETPAPTSTVTTTTTPVAGDTTSTTDASPTDSTTQDTSEAAAALALKRAVCAATNDPTVVVKAAAAWGTFDKPFAADSPWNSQPVSPVLGTDPIPKSDYFPLVAAGDLATEAFKAVASDGAVSVYGPNGGSIWDPDSETSKTKVVIPRWPAGVAPAPGGDGHAEIVDTVSGIVHSFWQLRSVNGRWEAAQYAWTALNGRGFGDSAHYFQGARSAGVSTLGGLIRKSEVADGATMYKHALTMSMAYNGLSSNPTYVFPATAADFDAATTNSGPFPIGSLMMLPASFDTSKLATPELRKVAQTLKTYGAYVVDRNTGTPFAIYVERGSNFELHKNGWNNAAANDLDVMRASMRRVMSAAQWKDGNGTSFAKFATNQNMLSMRGAWYRTQGTLDGVFDTWQQAVVFPATPTLIEQINGGGRAFAGVTWAKPAKGASVTLKSISTGGAKFRMTLNDSSTGAKVYDSGLLANGQTSTFAWPATNFTVTTVVNSGVGSQTSSVSAQLYVGASASPAGAPCGP